MALPLFYFEGAMQAGAEVWLEEETARHVVQVLRMQEGEQLQLADGKGSMAVAGIATAAKKKCMVKLLSVQQFDKPNVNMHLAVAFTKNAARNEWLLEKATELGAASIIPLITQRTEKQNFRYDRWKNILVSAMLQSQQYYLPNMPEARKLEEVLNDYSDTPQKLVAHCINEKERMPLPQMLQAGMDSIILIGPEGDFTPEEVGNCERLGFNGISLASQRLRTETAAMAVCAYFNTINNEVV